MKRLILTILILLIPAVGWGINFDDTDDVIQTAIKTRSDDVPITFMGWFKTTVNGGWIMGTFTSSNFYEVRVESDSDVTMYIDSPVGCSTETVSWVGTFDDGAWHLIVWGLDDSELAFLSVDGGAKQTGDACSGDITPTTEFFIGGRTSAGGYGGDVTEVAIWDAALTNAEIALLYNAKVKGMPLQIQPSSLWGYWPLDDEEDGSSADGDTFINRVTPGTADGTGIDGGNNTGLTAKAEELLTYP